MTNRGGMEAGQAELISGSCSVQRMLDVLVADYEKGGSVRMDKSLGIQRMPEGYALMLNADYTHFYWLRFDGQEGYIDWNKWRVRKGAIIHSSNITMSCTAPKENL